VRAYGSLASILELGAGFHPELTGAENVSLYASILGLRRQELASRWTRILEFSGVEDHMDTPIKYLSSGMVARLAFSIAISVDPDVLLLDEVLAIGDESFRVRCLRRLQDFHAGGGTLLLVSHELEQMADLCSRVVWLQGGKVVMDGGVEAVTEAYRRDQHSKA
jgi:ABC-2 type transport system ATP-binding protein